MTDRNILVPLDESPLSAKTIEKLIGLKESLPLPLTLLHVLDLSVMSYRGFAETDFRELQSRARTAAQQFLAARREEFAAAGIAATTLLVEGRARETICELADSGEYQLLVIGKHADSNLRNLLFGQVANFVVHHVKCPVLIV